MPWCALIEVHVHDRINMLNIVGLCYSMLIQSLLIFCCIKNKAFIVLGALYIYFCRMVWKGKVNADMSVQHSDSGNNRFPPTWCSVTVGDVFLASLLDRAAYTGSITQQSRWPQPHCLLRWNQGGLTGVMREVTEWDQHVFLSISSNFIAFCLRLSSQCTNLTP